MKIYVEPYEYFPSIAPMLSAMGIGGFSMSIPQGNKYKPHAGAKEKARRAKREARRSANSTKSRAV